MTTAGNHPRCNSGATVTTLRYNRWPENGTGSYRVDIAGPRSNRAASVSSF